jgi:hypothetical protein
MREECEITLPLARAIQDVEAVSRGVDASKLSRFSNGNVYREDQSIAHVLDGR